MDRSALEDAGFSEDQIEALFRNFAVRHHHHSIDEIDDLEEALEDAGVLDDVEDDG